MTTDDRTWQAKKNGIMLYVTINQELHIRDKWIQMSVEVDVESVACPLAGISSLFPGC